MQHFTSIWFVWFISFIWFIWLGWFKVQRLGSRITAQLAVEMPEAVQDYPSLAKAEITRLWQLIEDEPAEVQSLPRWLYASPYLNRARGQA